MLGESTTTAKSHAASSTNAKGGGNGDDEEEESLEEYFKRKHIEEINELCTIFTSQKLGINAEAKRA